MSAEISGEVNKTLENTSAVSVDKKEDKNVPIVEIEPKNKYTEDGPIMYGDLPRRGTPDLFKGLGNPKK